MMDATFFVKNGSEEAIESNAYTLMKMIESAFIHVQPAKCATLSNRVLQDHRCTLRHCARDRSCCIAVPQIQTNHEPMRRCHWTRDALGRSTGLLPGAGGSIGAQCGQCSTSDVSAVDIPYTAARQWRNCRMMNGQAGECSTVGSSFRTGLTVLDCLSVWRG